jgi:hypothetical protein
MHDQTLSVVAMRVSDPDRSPVGINRGDAAQLRLIIDRAFPVDNLARAAMHKVKRAPQCPAEPSRSGEIFRHERGTNWRAVSRFATDCKEIVHRGMSLIFKSIFP